MSKSLCQKEDQPLCQKRIVSPEYLHHLVQSMHNCKLNGKHLRKFRDNFNLGIILSEIKKNKYKHIIRPSLENKEEKKYKHFHYNGSFHKGLQHNLRDGRLVNSCEYQKLVNAIVQDEQKILASVPLAQNSQIKLVNPLASWATILVGTIQAALTMPEPPSLSSKEGAAEVLEVYSQALARDIPFINYHTDPLIVKLLDLEHLNDPEVINHLLDAPSNPLTPQTIFRGNSFGELLGPYLSQLLLLNVNAGAMQTPQLYYVPPTKQEALDQNFRVEWGVSLLETIHSQNGNLDLLPPPTPSQKLVPKYVYSGRSLAEIVHIDPFYQFYYQSGLILQSLGAKPNSGWPVFANQANLITSSGSAALQCILADVTICALKNAWYWKWQQFRKPRPEVFALWVHDVKANLVSNKNNFDLSNLVLQSKILDEIFQANNEWLPGSNSYTLPQAYREGSPSHPTFPAGHATIAGACATILKIFFDAEQTWLSLPGVISGSLGGIAQSLVQANANGSALTAYTGTDASLVTIGSEINKLASNVALGRDFSGIHFRLDGTQGIRLGEQVAIHYMEDILSTMVENQVNGHPPKITFRNFDGTLITIKPTLT